MTYNVCPSFGPKKTLISCCSISYSWILSGLQVFSAWFWNWNLFPEMSLISRVDYKLCQTIWGKRMLLTLIILMYLCKTINTLHIFFQQHYSYYFEVFLSTDLYSNSNCIIYSIPTFNNLSNSVLLPKINVKRLLPVLISSTSTVFELFGLNFNGKLFAWKPN